MYSPRGSYGSAPPPELSNNPFIEHPSNALSRYPDINGEDSPAGSNQFTSWLQPPSSPVNATSPGLLGPNQTGYGGYQAPQQTGWQGAGYSQANGYGGGYGGQVQAQPTGRPFQPSSSFGQQLSGQLTAAGYGAQAPAQQQPQYTGYPTSQPQYGQSYGQQQQQYQQPIQQQQTATYLAEFDPFSQQQQQQRSQPPQQSGAPSNSQYKSPHPREYVQQHKGELEAWDSYAWKQALNTFDALKEGWETRKREIDARAGAMGGAGLFGGGGGYGYGGYGQNYGQAQEYARLEQLSKEATANIDIVVAASFQMQEAHSGYRQSGDLASKRRVRESINAALNNLPDWPPQSW